MYIRLFSDLHLELRRKGPQFIQGWLNKMDPSRDGSAKDTLILAGDVGNPTKPIYRFLLTTISPLFEHIFLVAGNHEYYQREGKSMEEVETQIEVVTASFPNVHFLNRRSMIIHRTRFLGCTLWTHSDPDLYHRISDYYQIPGMTVERCNALHQRDRDWLTEQLEMEDPSQYDKTVVITHHLPSFKLVGEKFEQHPLNTFFANHLDSLVSKVDLWCCGHTHVAMQIQIDTCRCYINPVGYVGENTGYQPDLRIQL